MQRLLSEKGAPQEKIPAEVQRALAFIKRDPTGGLEAARGTDCRMPALAKKSPHKPRKQIKNPAFRAMKEGGDPGGDQHFRRRPSAHMGKR